MPFLLNKLHLVGGALWGWDCREWGGDQAAAPIRIAGCTSPGLRTARWLFSCCVGQVAAQDPDWGEGLHPVTRGRKSAPGLGLGRRGKCVLRPCT